MRALAILSLSLCLAPTKSFAAPAYLLNKTITVSVTTTASFVAENGRTGTGSRHTTFTTYVSTQGHIFSRRVRQDRNASSTGEAATATGINMRFEGDKLVGVTQFISGAARMTISFDSSGQSCTANFLYGRESGRQMSWKGVNGVTYTATSPWVASNVSCSIAAGNAFAGS